LCRNALPLGKVGGLEECGFEGDFDDSSIFYVITIAKDSFTKIELSIRL